MGYRNYIGRISKKVYEENKNKSVNDLRKLTVELHELGKYLDKKYTEQLVILHDHSSEDEYLIVDVNAIKMVWEEYSKSHLEYLKKILDFTNNPEKEECIYFGVPNATNYIESEIRKWSRPSQLIYDDSLEDAKIVKSWDFQHNVFELIHIYKNFDIENDYLVWYGY